MSWGAQGFINQSFEKIHSVDAALGLLRQFKAILQRDTLRNELDSKYLVIFQHYGADLDTVQARVSVPLDAQPDYLLIALRDAVDE